VDRHHPDVGGLEHGDRLGAAVAVVRVVRRRVTTIRVSPGPNVTASLDSL
jgi:hypothetical protein